VSLAGRKRATKAASEIPKAHRKNKPVDNGERAE
jgi:hypothetical protein